MGVQEPNDNWNVKDTVVIVKVSIKMQFSFNFNQCRLERQTNGITAILEYWSYKHISQ